MSKSILINARLVASTRIAAPAADTRGILIATGDFNADRKIDFAITGMDVGPDAVNTSDIRIMLSQGGSSFIEATSILGNLVPSYQTVNLLSADLNRDGFTDLIVGRSGGDNDTVDNVYGATQLIYLSNGSGGFTAIQSSRSAYMHNAMIADVNKDSYPDAFFFATTVGTSELMLSDKQSVSFTNERLPLQARTASMWDGQDVIEMRNGYLVKGQHWHQHNTAFNDINRDGNPDMVMFFGSGSSEGLIYLNDGKKSPNFDIAPRIKFDAKIPGLLSTGSHWYGIFNPDGSWAGLKVIQQGANYYDTIQLDLNYDGWGDIIAVATMNNKVYSQIDNGPMTFEKGTDNFNHGTFFKVLLNDGIALKDDTENRIKQPDVTIYAFDGNGQPTHNGHSNMRVIDFNGDGNLDFMANANVGRPLNYPNYEGDQQTIFMLNNGKGVFEQVIINQLENNSFDPIPIDGKLGFIATVPPTDQEWETQGFPPREDYQFFFYKTDVPWTVGDERNNFVYGTEANDDIDGGVGVDTYVALGRATEYKLSKLGNNTIIDDQRGLGGVDTLSNVERIRFYDKAFAYDIEGNAGQAYRLYKAALNRAPDEVGLGGWISVIDKGTALTKAARGFVDSVEFSAKYGALDNRGFVNRLYNNVLGRDGEPQGLNDWVAVLAQGHTRSEVLVGFSESPENQAKVLSLIQNGITYQEWIGG